MTSVDEHNLRSLVVRGFRRVGIHYTPVASIATVSMRQASSQSTLRYRSGVSILNRRTGSGSRSTGTATWWCGAPQSIPAALGCIRSRRPRLLGLGRSGTLASNAVTFHRLLLHARGVVSNRGQGAVVDIAANKPARSGRDSTNTSASSSLGISPNKVSARFLTLIDRRKRSFACASLRCLGAFRHGRRPRASTMPDGLALRLRTCPTPRRSS